MNAKPNIVFIMADDMGYGDVACYNPESHIPTPNMDRLGREGLVFTDAHSPASVCTPTRYGVLTGRYCWRSRLKSSVLWTDYDEPLIPTDRLTVAAMLKRCGYATACVGKWHLGMNFHASTRPGYARGKTHHMNGYGGTRNVDFRHPIEGGPADLGFDDVLAVPGGHNLEPHFYVEGDRPAVTPTLWRKRGEPSRPGISARETHEGWMSVDCDDEAVGPMLVRRSLDFIDAAAEAGTPFFLYFASQAPHRPCTPPEFAAGKSRAGVRGDMVYEYDWAVGQVMAKLESIGIADNTLLIVTSDNGACPVSDEDDDFGHKSCGDLRAFKGSIYEGGHRVPFLVRWPDRIRPGQRSDELVCLADLMATCADIAGFALPSDAAEDSTSLLPVFDGASFSEDERPPVVHHAGNGQFGIRRGPWKLVLDHANQPKELFNLQLDPREQTCVLADNADIADNLFRRLETIRRNGRSS